MGTPKEYLPLPYTNDDICIFFATAFQISPTSIEILPSSGEFHLIYLIRFPHNMVKKRFPTANLDASEIPNILLRISGDHFRNIKTINEVAIITWLHQNTTVPVPQILDYSASSNNSLGQEWILFVCDTGSNLSNIVESFSPTQMRYILDQLIDVLLQLYSRPWSHIGGLRFSEPDGASIVPGPVLGENLWYEGEISKFWPATESTDTLNVTGPFATYSAYVIALVDRYIHAVEIHPSLEFMRDLIPRLRSFAIAVGQRSEKLNNIPLRLAHKDLHFGNILVDPSTARITCIIDWEFAGVVPYTQWDPSGAFLWNGKDTESSRREKHELFDKFKARCDKRNASFLYKEAALPSKELEYIDAVHNFLRAIVEVCPRGYRLQMAREWRQTVIHNLGKLGI